MRLTKEQHKLITESIGKKCPVDGVIMKNPVLARRIRPNPTNSTELGLPEKRLWDDIRNCVCVCSFGCDWEVGKSWLGRYQKAIDEIFCDYLL